MKKHSMKYRTRKNPPTTELPVSDEIAFEEKDNKKTIEMKAVKKEDIKKGEGKKEESVAPLLLGLGFLTVIGFGLWAISRRSPPAPFFAQGPGFQQRLQISQPTLAGMPVSIIPSSIEMPEAPTWSKTGRQQTEVPDGSQRPPQSNTRRQGQGTGQT